VPGRGHFGDDYSAQPPASPDHDDIHGLSGPNELSLTRQKRVLDVGATGTAEAEVLTA
jgi:hypothetical protein